MLTSEFYEISGINFSLEPDEWWSINEAYNRSTLSKEDFIAEWMKANKERVDEANAKMKERKAIGKELDKLFRVRDRINLRRGRTADKAFTKEHKETMLKHKITIENGCGGYKMAEWLMCDVQYEIDRLMLKLQAI